MNNNENISISKLLAVLDIQDDESLSNMVNNSELAKTFLEYLGLIK